ncbi:lysophospholipid acyltransferase family protein [Nannocystaceae bacterium ST9]
MAASLVPRFLRIPLSGLAFFVFYFGASVVAWILLPLHRRRTRDLPDAERQLALDRFLQSCYAWAIGFMARLGLMTYRLPVLGPELPPQPWVIAANHPSLIDVLFIKAAIPGVVVLVKAELFKEPSLRRILQTHGDFAGREREELRIGETTVLDTFVERLAAGRSVLVFPEGTRSPAWRLRRFRRGAAEAAIRADVPIVPVFVLSDPPTLKKGDKWYQMPRRVPHFEVEVLPAIASRDRGAAELTLELRDRLAERLELARERARARHREEFSDTIG